MVVWSYGHTTLFTLFIEYHLWILLSITKEYEKSKLITILWLLGQNGMLIQ
jgi:hypothetical protein